MKNWITPDANEFYVGYLPNAPRKIGSAIRGSVFMLIMAAVCVASITAVEQKKFSSANFEYGLATEIEGYLFVKPVPHLQVPLGKDIQNKELYKTILLVGFGKSGAEKFIDSNSRGVVNAYGAKVRIMGSLIYGHGNTLLQVDEAGKFEYLKGGYLSSALQAGQKKISLTGEIVDPKCYFGVMKPGEGKTHRSCAIRCIAGGIPPVFKTDSSGYFVLVNENNDAISTEIADIVGDNVMLEGTTMDLHNWKLLQIDSEIIRKLSSNKKLKEKVIAFETGVTQCN